MKKWIKFLLLTGIIISLLNPIFSSARGKYDEGQILEGVLEELRGEFLEGDINIGGVILDEFLNKEEMKTMAEDIKSKIGVINQGMEDSEDFIYEEDFNQLTVYGYDGQGNPITIMIGSYIDHYNHRAETTLFINLIKRGQKFNINGIMDNMEEVFDEFHKPVDITTCIIGTLEEDKTDDILKQDIIKAMEKFKLEIVEEYIDESIVSYTAYTPLIDHSIFSGRKQVNFNLATRYNEIEDKNYIWIGTPIITTGY